MNHAQIKLPSGCSTYEGVDPNGISIRPFSGTDEELIAETRPINLEKALKTLIERTVKGIPDVGKMTLGDRMHLLLWHVINSFSPNYTETIICETCMQKVDVTIDFRELTIIELKDGFGGTEEVKLNNGEAVTLKLLTIEDELAISGYEQDGHDSWSFRWACTIVSDKDVIARTNYYKLLGTKDTSRIRAFQEKYKHGPDLSKVPYICPKCGGVGTIAVPFRLELFLPSDAELSKYI